MFVSSESPATFDDVPVVGAAAAAVTRVVDIRAVVENVGITVTLNNQYSSYSNRLCGNSLAVVGSYLTVVSA